MSAIILSERQEDRAFEVARDIGEAIRHGREARGESQKEAAVAVDTWQTTVGNIERGASPNLKLGNVVKLLDRYGLELAVIQKLPHSAGVGAEG